MKLKLPDLPYDFDALEPHISARTVEIHYTKHHQAYVDKTKKAVAGTPLEGASVEEIISAARKDSEKQGLFNTAAQIWNHALYWQSMQNSGGGEPSGALAAQIVKDFGSIDDFRKAFKDFGTGEFGSGYVWLIFEAGGLRITSTTDAEIPVENLEHALLNMDVWEHSYYLDYQNERGRYIDAFLHHLVNWDHAAQRFEALADKKAA